MKLAYIILCHKHPEVVGRIAKKLTEGTENEVFIHVDKKYSQIPFEEVCLNNKQVHFIDNRVDIYWGGFSSVEATINALKFAIKHDCKRFILLQGMDYPIHNNQYIDDFFKNHQDVEFLRAYNITSSKRKSNYMKCYGWHFFDGINRNKRSIKTYFARAIEAINKLGIKYRKGYFKDHPTKKKYEIYWGWGHFALTHQCVEYILNFYEENPKFNRYFKHIFPADETYFQTIVYNSLFKTKTFDGEAVDEQTHDSVESMLNLTYFEYPNQVTVFRKIEDYDRIPLGKYLFSRKFDQTSSQLMDFIDVLNKIE